MSDLQEFLSKTVRVITTDARLFEGKLEGFDKSTNIILSNTREVIVYPQIEEENQILSLGVYLLRGDGVVCVGEVENEVDWIEVKGETLKSTKNAL